MGGGGGGHGPSWGVPPPPPRALLLMSVPPPPNDERVPLLLGGGLRSKKRPPPPAHRHGPRVFGSRDVFYGGIWGGGGGGAQERAKLGRVNSPRSAGWCPPKEDREAALTRTSAHGIRGHPPPPPTCTAKWHWTPVAHRDHDPLGRGRLPHRWGCPAMHWKGGRYPPPTPLQGPRPVPSHCPPDAKCQTQQHL